MQYTIPDCWQKFNQQLAEKKRLKAERLARRNQEKWNRPSKRQRVHNEALQAKADLKAKIASKRKSRRYSRLRAEIMKRANGHCELCHQPYDLLVMHHNDMVKDAPEKIFDPANVFAVCYTCHADIHPWLR